MVYDCLIVGAGWAGCVLAERLANELNQKVLLVERRAHIAGNAYDGLDEHGVIVQRYGPHIFHTSARHIWDYVSRFTSWNGYVHRVLAQLTDKAVYLPINLDTMERLYNRPFTAEQCRDLLEQRRVPVETIANARDVVISQIGWELYELFYRNYTKKQWGLSPEELAPEVTRRLPVRFDRDTRYFDDPYQGVPEDGFTSLFERMIDSPNITLRLRTDYRSVAGSERFGRLIYTGPIDEYFDCVHGRLSYRSVTFRFETFERERFQEAGVVNYPGEQDYTRITEFKHLTLQKHPKTTICYEYGAAEGPPCYPVPTEANRRLYERYRARAEALDGVHFVGRLAQCEYLNMDQVVDRALAVFEEIRTRG